MFASALPYDGYMTPALELNRSKARPDIGKDGFCNAKNRSGGRCARPAGWGTNHAGMGACKSHGGATPSAGLSVARSMAITMGAPLDVEPHDALIHCVRITAGEVAYASEMVAQLSSEDALVRPTTSVSRSGTSSQGSIDMDEERKGPQDLNIWIRVRQEAVDRLARYAKMALDAGVDERRVRVAEGLATALVPVLEAIFKDLKLTSAQRKKAPAIMRSHLLTLEAQEAE